MEGVEVNKRKIFTNENICTLICAVMTFIGHFEGVPENAHHAPEKKLSFIPLRISM
jgi:hypothetical protein